MAETPVLNTARLRLRPFRLGDASRFVSLAGNPAVARMTSDIPHPLHIWQCRRWLRQARGEVRFGIEHEDQLIGGVGYFCQHPNVGELGFWLGEAYWRQGFATEASRAVVTYAFTVGNLEALTSANFIDNPASARTLTKLGFSANGRMRAQSIARGQDIDCTTWRLEREAAQVIYRLPPVTASASGGWTKLRALFSGR